ncbi:hypothetical protein FPSM_01743 [Flavobacterium psychrophilum]|nr:hypothetical protein FPSM_01743 [Flavobacterium psychrophilum]
MVLIREIRVKFIIFATSKPKNLLGKQYGKI